MPPDFSPAQRSHGTKGHHELMFSRASSPDSPRRRFLFCNGNLTLALAGWWCLLWARSGCGGFERAPGWCGWAVESLLCCCCGGAVCWGPVISLPQESVVVGEVGQCESGGVVASCRQRGRPPDGASCSRRAGLQQCKSFVEMCIVSCLSA
jgi:hypothetical protein